jgi:hypothetical protein
MVQSTFTRPMASTIWKLAYCDPIARIYDRHYFKRRLQAIASVGPGLRFNLKPFDQFEPNNPIEKRLRRKSVTPNF